MCRLTEVFFILAQLLCIIEAVSAKCINDQCLEIQSDTSGMRMSEAGEKEYIICEGTNIKPMEMEWYSPNGTVIGTRSSENDRVYVKRKNGKEIDKFLVILSFSRIALGDNGKWTCKGSNLSDTIDVSVGLKASVDRSEECKVVQKHANVTMNCTVKGIPTPTIQWYDKNMQLIEKGVNPRFVISQNNDTHFLLIRNVDYTDSGKYTCEAAQTRITHYAQKVITLQVQRENEAVSAVCLSLEIWWNDEVLCCEGEKKAIYCVGTNVEPMELEWYSPDGIVIRNRSSKNDRVYVERRYLEHKFFEVLIFSSLQTKDNGTWTCKDKKLKLFDSIDVSVGVKASVDRSKESMVVQKKADVKMNCTVKGVPTPKVYWLYWHDSRDEKMQQIENGANPRFVISQNNDTHFLLIKNVDYTDSGYYLCKATQTSLAHFARKLINLQVQRGNEDGSSGL